MLLVEETKSERLVGSTNEWVLDNYYMISEQEKVMKVELKGIEKGKMKVERRRITMIEQLLTNYLRKCHHQIDKGLLFRYLSQLQVKQNDYLTYPEVCALLPLTKHILIKELADLCREMEASKKYHYNVTDKDQANMEHLNEVARENLMMMNIFNTLKKMTKLPMAELIDAVSFSERMLKGEKAGMYDQMQDKTKEDYRAKVIRLSKRRAEKGERRTEYELVKELVAKADERGEHVGWQLFPPKRWNARAHWYIWIVVLATLGLAAMLVFWLFDFRISALSLIFTVLMWVPMSQIVIDVFNQVLYKIHKPTGTFKLKFKDGLIPKEYATMVIMPTILKNKAKTVELLEQLEVYYLSNINRASEGQRLESRPQNLYYTLIGDAASYKEADAPWDEEVVEAGLAKARAEFDIETGIIVCMMRGFVDDENNLKMVRAAREMLGSGVVACDIAGDEDAHPMALQTELFNEVKRLGMPYTIHAGETGNIQNVRDAIALGTKRLGHGIAMANDADLMNYCSSHKIGVELCPTSNIQTRAYDDIKDCPISIFMERGIPVSLNTDNRTVSNTNLTKEFNKVVDAFGFDEEQLKTIYINSVEMSFASDEVKNNLINKWR